VKYKGRPVRSSRFMGVEVAGCLGPMRENAE
jgi:hypothetical protein